LLRLGENRARANEVSISSISSAAVKHLDLIFNFPGFSSLNTENIFLPQSSGRRENLEFCTKMRWFQVGKLKSNTGSTLAALYYSQLSVNFVPTKNPSLALLLPE